MTSNITYDSRAADKRAFRRMMETPVWPAPTPVRDALHVFAAFGLSALAAVCFTVAGMAFYLA